jgi:MFS family permease
VTATRNADVRSAVWASFAVFFGSGFGFASWASRIPSVRAGLALTPQALGLLLLSVAAGSVVALPLAGPIVTHVGARRTTAVMAAVFGAALALVGLGYLSGVWPVAVGLVLLGFANGAWDVAMNVHAARTERELGRSVMPRFHAAWSLGTVTGALLGSVLVAAGVPVTAHLLGAALLVGIGVPLATRAFLRDAPPSADDERREPARRALTAWTERRTLLIGVFVLAFAFAEGTANDWVGVATIDGYATSAGVGTLAFATFVAAMTLGRWFGPQALDRYGRVVVVRATAALAVAGSLLFVFAGLTALAFAGIVLWGVGTSLGFPVGMSAGSDDPDRAAARVSVIASIGYCAFLAGPPLIGFLGAHVTVLRALVTVSVMLGVAALIAGEVRQVAGDPEA